MRCCSDDAFRGQATVEAAFLAPSILLAMLLLTQPAIILFDRAVMESAAAEGCRMLETLAPGSEDEARRAVERRLSAIPDVGIFHAGPWSVELSGGEGQGRAVVEIAHSLRPLPLVGVGMRAAGLVDADGMIRQSVVKDAETTEEWVAKSRLGADMGAWVDRWEEKA